MTRLTWEDYPGTTTPLSAAQLNDLEARKPEAEYQAINVRDFAGGSLGQQLTNAIAALPATGATLFIPRGLYTGAFDVASKNHLTVTGEGSATVIHNTTASDHALSFTDCDELTVSDLRVQGETGTFDGLHLENCQRARVGRVYCKGTGRYGIYAERCFGIVVDQCVVGIDSVSPYPTGVTNSTGGLVLYWDGADATSGCNQFVVNGGFYVIGTTQGWAIEVNRAEGGIINGPITSSSRGGISLDTCTNLVINGYYGEQNPSDVEYETGTATTTTASTAVTGASTLWNTNDGQGNKNAMLGKFFIIGTTYGRVAAIGSDTAITLEANWGGATAGGQAYRMQGCDLYMKSTTNCTVNFGRGGGAVILEGSSRNILNLLTESIFLDSTSSRNYGRVITNRASSAATRMVDAGTGNRLTQISFQSGALIANDPIVASDTSNVTLSGYVIGNGLVTNVTNGGGFLQLQEQSPDPGAAPSNQVRVFSKDNGSGKTQLCVIFGTGSPIVIATEV